MSKKKSISNTFVWILLAMLILGLAGFGATGLSGTARIVARAGDETVTVDEFARALQQEIRAIEQQSRQALPISRVRELGLDRNVLGRLTGIASIDQELNDLGLSIGDENLQREIIALPSFQGLDGQFDRDAYRLALSSAGLSEAEFEADLRKEAARTILQGALAIGTPMPDTFTDTMIAFIGARRSFTWTPLGDNDLAAPLPEPSEADLRRVYDENPETFTLPRSKTITYLHLSPEARLDTVEVEEEALRNLFAERAERYNLPERRLVERLVFADQATAQDAAAQLAVGGTTFDLLVEQRGLDLADVDLGDVRAAELGDAAAGVFDAQAGDVVGPLPSSLGPALFRVNAVLAARDTSFEDAHDELRRELAADRARRVIEVEAHGIDDLLAGGATLEEAAQETGATLDTLSHSAEDLQGMAAYPAFRQAAAEITAEDFPKIGYLRDGGAFAMRLDGEEGPRPEPFDAARNRVIDLWAAGATRAALSAQATSALADLAAGADFAAAGLLPRSETDLIRSAYIDDTPPGFVAEVFTMDVGEVRLIPDGAGVIVVRLESTAPPREDSEMDRLRSAVQRELDQALAQDLFADYADAVQRRVRAQVDEPTLNAVMSSFYQ